MGRGREGRDRRVGKGEGGDEGKGKGREKEGKGLTPALCKFMDPPPALTHHPPSL